MEGRPYPVLCAVFFPLGALNSCVCTLFVNMDTPCEHSNGRSCSVVDAGIKQHGARMIAGTRNDSELV